MLWVVVVAVLALIARAIVCQIRAVRDSERWRAEAQEGDARRAAARELADDIRFGRVPAEWLVSVLATFEHTPLRVVLDVIYMRDKGVVDKVLSAIRKGRLKADIFQRLIRGEAGEVSRAAAFLLLKSVIERDAKVVRRCLRGIIDCARSLLRQEDIASQCGALDLLVASREIGCADLQYVLRHSIWYVRRDALKLLPAMGAAGLTLAGQTMLYDPDWRIRGAAICLLPAFGPRAGVWLDEAIAESDVRNRETAAKCAAELGPAGLDAALRLREDEHPGVVRCAEQALGVIAPLLEDDLRRKIGAGRRREVAAIFAQVGVELDLGVTHKAKDMIALLRQSLASRCTRAA